MGDLAHLVRRMAKIERLLDLPPPVIIEGEAVPPLIRVYGGPAALENQVHAHIAGERHDAHQGEALADFERRMIEIAIEAKATHVVVAGLHGGTTPPEISDDDPW